MCKGGLANMCQDFALLSHIICFFPGNCQENAMGLRHRPLLNNSQDLLSIFSQQELEQVSSNIAYRSVCPRRLQWWWWWWPGGGGASTGTAVRSRGPMAAPPVSSTSPPPHTGLYTGDITLCWYNDNCVPLHCTLSWMFQSCYRKLCPNFSAEFYNHRLPLHRPFAVPLNPSLILTFGVGKVGTEQRPQSQLWSLINITFNCLTILWSSWGLSNISWGFNISKCSIHTRYR